jgi:hypothetical protein
MHQKPNISISSLVTRRLESEIEPKQDLNAKPNSQMSPSAVEKQKPGALIPITTDAIPDSRDKVILITGRLLQNAKLNIMS